MFIEHHVPNILPRILYILLPEDGQVTPSFRKKY